MAKDIKNNKNDGFTLVEILVVMGILAIIASLGLFFSMENYRSSSFRNERDLLVSALEHSRAQSVNNVCFGATCPDGKSHGVHFFPKGDINANTFVIFQGDNFVSNDPFNEIINFDNKAVYVDTTSTIDIIFNRLSGDLMVLNGETEKNVVLKDDAMNISTININLEGRIDWNN